MYMHIEYESTESISTFIELTENLCYNEGKQYVIMMPLQSIKQQMFVHTGPA